MNIYYAGIKKIAFSEGLAKKDFNRMNFGIEGKD